MKFNIALSLSAFVFVASVMVLVERAYRQDRPDGSALVEPTRHPIERDVRYVRDSRTWLCFAYRYGAETFDGPSLALAAVPCESVPSDLLENAP